MCLIQLGRIQIIVKNKGKNVARLWAKYFAFSRLRSSSSQMQIAVSVETLRHGSRQLLTRGIRSTHVHQESSWVPFTSIQFAQSDDDFWSCYHVFWECFFWRDRHRQLVIDAIADGFARLVTPRQCRAVLHHNLPHISAIYVRNVHHLTGLEFWIRFGFVEWANAARACDLAVFFGLL